MALEELAMEARFEAIDAICDVVIVQAIGEGKNAQAIAQAGVKFTICECQDCTGRGKSRYGRETSFCVWCRGTSINTDE